MRGDDGSEWVHRENWILLSREPVTTLFTVELSGGRYWPFHLLLFDTQMYKHRQLSGGPCTQLGQSQEGTAAAVFVYMSVAG